MPRAVVLVLALAVVLRSGREPAAETDGLGWREDISSSGPRS
jgi:hypothetical protein